MDTSQIGKLFVHNMAGYAAIVLLGLQLVSGMEVNYTAGSDEPVNVTATVLPSLIRCYECESFSEDPGVCDAFDNANNTVPEIDCPWPKNACLKITTVRFTVGDSGDNEVVANQTSRLCATREGADDCKKSDGAQSKTVECFCKNDLCNTGHVTMASSVTWLTITAVLLYSYIA